MGKLYATFVSVESSVQVAHLVNIRMVFGM